MIRSERAARLTRVVHAHSDRADGAVGNDTVEGHAAARARMIAALGGAPERLVVPHQVHGTRVAVVDASHAGRTLRETDGLATAAAGLPLLVQGADCPAVLLADDEAGVVAVLHSGWRGTVRRIAAEGVAAVRSIGGRPDRITAAVFPGIGACCFEIGPEVADEFRTAFGPAAAAWSVPGPPGTDRSRLDLAAAIRTTLCDAGVPARDIDVVPGCTMCGGRLHSHRGSRGAPLRHGLFALIRARQFRAGRAFESDAAS